MVLENNNSLELVKRLKRLFLLSLVGVAILGIAEGGVVAWGYNLQKHDAHIINVAGRQRMLSQRISHAFYALTNENINPRTRTIYRHKLREAHHTFVKTHQYFLFGGSPDQDLEHNDAKARGVLQDVSPSLMRMAELGLLAMEDPRTAMIKREEFFLAEEETLRGLEKFVGVLVESQEAESDAIFVIEIVLGILLLLVVVAEGWWIFRPALGVIRIQFQEFMRQDKELREAMLAAEASSKSKTAFLANMSHELRTPLNAILGFAEILQEKANDDAMRDAADTVHHNGGLLLALIDNLLDLSRIESGREVFTYNPCDLKQLLSKILSVQAVNAESKGLSLVACMDAELDFPLVVDERRISQVLMNLLGNAIKFTEMGEVKVAISAVDVKDASVMIRFDIIDSGLGIEQSKIDQIFEPFSQVDNSMTRRFGGAGMGLAICKRLVEGMGGEIFASSIVGRGSTFSFLLRCDRAEMHEVKLEPPSIAPLSPAEKPPEKRKPALPLEGCSILLVEDGPDNQKLISFLLEKSGAKVDLAENGQVACDKINNPDIAPFDLILMDMQMPVLDGYEATRRLRSQGFETPIVALTAHAMEGDRERCLDAGCNDYETKPINKKRLVKVVNKHRSGSNLGGENHERA